MKARMLFEAAVEESKYISALSQRAPDKEKKARVLFEAENKWFRNASNIS